MAMTLVAGKHQPEQHALVHTLSSNRLPDRRAVQLRKSKEVSIKAPIIPVNRDFVGFMRVAGQVRQEPFRLSLPIE